MTSDVQPERVRDSRAALSFNGRGSKRLRCYSSTRNAECKLAVELFPTHTSNSSGSSTQDLRASLQYVSSFLPSVKCTVLVSPGCRATRSKPFSSRMGREVEPAR